MEHYDELGVTPTATAAEIRSSYLSLARRFHPDRLGSASAADRAVAAERMARINAAWAVLGHTERRASYDLARTSGGASPSTGATVRDPGRTWTPYDEDADDIDPRLLDDTPIGAPTLRRELTFLPVVLSVTGVFTTIVGLVIGLGALIGLGLVLLVAAGLSFLVIPLIALAKSSQADRL